MSNHFVPDERVVRCNHNLVVIEVVKCQKCGMVWLPPDVPTHDGKGTVLPFEKDHRHTQNFDTPQHEPFTNEGFMDEYKDAKSKDRVTGIQPGEDVVFDTPEGQTVLAVVPSLNKSRAESGVTYTISADDNGKLHCTCPQFVYLTKACKHTVAFQKTNPEYSLG